MRDHAPAAPDLEEDDTKDCCSNCPHSLWHWAGVIMTIMICFGVAITVRSLYDNMGNISV